MISSMLEPASRFSKTVATGIRVSLNTHAPLRLSGTLSTAVQFDQSRLAMLELLLSGYAKTAEKLPLEQFQRTHAPSNAFTRRITSKASATYSTSAFPRAQPQPASRLIARRWLTKRQPTTCGSSPWQIG